MIAPTAEAVDGSSQIASMGRNSLALWPLWLAELPIQVFYRDSGTILLWHREDAGEAVRTERMLAARHPHAGLKRLNSAAVAEREPALGTRFPRALYIPDDAQVDNRAFLRVVAIALEEAHVECHWETFVVHGTFPDAGIVVDCRGMGARRDWPNLLGVRGEIVRLHAPEIELHHMLRLLHPRYPVYIVPRAEGRLIVGATSIESDDRSTVSVRGALELLASAYSLLPALAEKGITVAASKLHQVAKEAKREWTADDAFRYASGVMARTQEKEREQQRSADDGKSYPLGQQEDQPVEAGNQATSTK
jgi:glycine oxidase